MKKLLIFVLIATLFSANALAAKKYKKTKKTNKITKLSKKKSKTKKEKTTKKPPLFGAQVAFSSTSDYADERSPRLRYNKLGLSLSTTALPYNIILMAKVGVTYKTLGGALYEENPQENGVHPTDTVLIALKSFELNKAINAFMEGKATVLGKHSGTLMLMNIFPTSDAARYAGYNSSPGAQAAINSSFFDGIYNISNSINFIKVLNTYTNHPASGSPSPNYMSVFSHSHSIGLGYGFSIAAGVSFKYLKDESGFNNTSFENFASINFGYKGLGTSVAYSGGDHTTNDNVELWYVDESRRMVTFSVSYKF